MSTEKLINVTERSLRALDRSAEVANWARNNQGRVQEIVQSYDTLVLALNSMLDDGNISSEAMPATAFMAKVLGDRRLPTSSQIGGFDLLSGLRSARGPMIRGQEIKKREITPTPEDVQYAIGTTSMDTTPEALAVGTIGHLLERTIFAMLSKEGVEPEGGWMKDQFLHAIDEALMLKSLEMQSISPLEPFFMQPNEMGGLGWLNQGKKSAFFKAYIDSLPLSS